MYTDCMSLCKTLNSRVRHKFYSDYLIKEHNNDSVKITKLLKMPTTADGALL